MNYSIRFKNDSSSNSLTHHGIKGQQWGIRRFQNEDGTLTDEGRARYLKDYEQREKQADIDYERAQRQIADIEKNGWNAKSAFAKSFVKQMRDEGMLNDDNLKYFKGVFEEDAAKALADKRAAKSGRDFIEKNTKVTYDDILRVAEKSDKENKKLTENDYTREDKYRKEAEAIGNELSLERQKDIKRALSEDSSSENVKINLTYDDKKEKEYRKIPEKELRSYIKTILSYIDDPGARKGTAKMLEKYPPSVQMAILGALFNGDYEMA